MNDKNMPSMHGEMNERIKTRSLLDGDTLPTCAKPGERRSSVISQATKLVNLLCDIEVFTTPGGKPYATFEVKGHQETCALRSTHFKTYLQGRCYSETGNALTAKAHAEVAGILEAKAVGSGIVHDVFLRTAWMGNRVLLDLGTHDWSVVEVTSQGWSVVQHTDVRFRRSRGMMPLPVPVRGGDAVAGLRRILNLNPESARDDIMLLIGWLVAALRGFGPFPVLALSGEQGTAKSSASRAIRGLIDPNEAPLRATPADERDLLIAAQNSWVLAFDNLSYIPDWLSDALCRLATGGGFVTRQLYTDEEESIFNAQRPILFNGIEEVATRSDLLDRMLIVELAVIGKHQRKTEDEIWFLYKQVQPQILSALLDGVATALARYGSVSLREMPRMADFAKWVAAAAPAFGWTEEEFLGAYERNRAQAHDVALDASVVAQAILRHMKERNTWSGTASELLAVLTSGAIDHERRSKAWPQSPGGMSKALRRHIPNLREQGLNADFVKSGNRRIYLNWKGVE